eukprot:223976-Chlamydomonas_euryale.AAC.1
MSQREGTPLWRLRARHGCRCLEGGRDGRVARACGCRLAFEESTDGAAAGVHGAASGGTGTTPFPGSLAVRASRYGCAAGFGECDPGRLWAALRAQPRSAKFPRPKFDIMWLSGHALRAVRSECARMAHGWGCGGEHSHPFILPPLRLPKQPGARMRSASAWWRAIGNDARPRKHLRVEDTHHACYDRYCYNAIAALRSSWCKL